MQGGFLFLPFSPTFGVGWGDGRDSSFLGGEKDLGVQKGSLIGLPILLPKYGKLLALMLRSESLIASGPTIQSPVPLARNRGVYSMNGSRMGEKRRNAFGHSPIGRKPRRFSHFPPRLWMVAWVHHCRRGEREVKHEEGRETGRTRRDIQQFDNIGSFRETISVLNRNLDLSPAPIYLEQTFLLANPAFLSSALCCVSPRPVVSPRDRPLFVLWRSFHLHFPPLALLEQATTRAGCHLQKMERPRTRGRGKKMKREAAAAAPAATAAAAEKTPPLFCRCRKLFYNTQVQRQQQSGARYHTTRISI